LYPYRNGGSNFGFDAWELKCIGLILVFVYAFFKFAWSYRLFNYVVGPVRHHRGCGDRDVAAAIRSQCMARNGNLEPDPEKPALGVTTRWVGSGFPRDKRGTRLRRDHAQNDQNNKLARARKILRREGEIEHPPFAVTIRR
jgi:hypothetical protein